MNGRSKSNQCCPRSPRVSTLTLFLFLGFPSELLQTRNFIRLPRTAPNVHPAQQFVRPFYLRISNQPLRQSLQIIRNKV